MPSVCMHGPYRSITRHTTSLATLGHTPHCRLATAEQLIELSAAMELLRTHTVEAQAEGILRVWRGIHPSLGISVLSPVHLR